MTVIHEFSSSNQSQPASNLIEMPDGGFLGMTGAPIDGTANAASIYQLKSNGEFTTLFQFSPGGSQSASGAPNLNSTPGALTHASDGNLYGVCYAGGQYGQGSVFRLTTAGRFTGLHDFQGSDGSQPGGALVEGTDGNLYGVHSMEGYPVTTVAPFFGSGCPASSPRSTNSMAIPAAPIRMPAWPAAPAGICMGCTS